MEQNYTFLAVAPGSFTVNGRYYKLEVGRPFEAPLNAARIIASPTFSYRKHVRLITPLPPKEEVKPKVEEVKAKEPETTSKKKVEAKVAPIVEPAIVEEPKAVKPTKTKEVKEATPPSKLFQP
jgi:hypothetical protein